jgi:hypothetical protein
MRAISLATSGTASPRQCQARFGPNSGGWKYDVGVVDLIEEATMDDHGLVANWQNKLVVSCEASLERRLSPVELQSIRQYGGFLALEMIEDTVRHASPDEIVSYLAALALT